MTRIIMIAFALFSSHFLFAAEGEQSVYSKLKEVTVFVQGAELNRTAQVSLKPGHQFLVFTDLSTSIDSRTIQVGGKGDFTILSVNYRTNYLKKKDIPEGISKLELKIKELNKKIKVEQDVKSALAVEWQLMLANKNMQGKEKFASAEDIKAMANLFRVRLAEIKQLERSSDEKTVKLKKSLQEVNGQLGELRSKINKHVGEVVVEVRANKELRANFKLSYLTRQASWVPAYEIRGEKDKSSINWTYNAKVYQQTGMDWKNVKLTISTAYPLQNNTKPSIHPWVLSFIQMQNRYNVNTMSNRAFDMKKPQAESVQELSVTAVDYKEKDALTANEFTERIENTLNTSYKINLNYTIPSDGKYHTVKIQEYEMPAEQEHYVAPKLDRDAFLLAKIHDWDQYNLLPGDANLYYDGTYIGQGFINTASTNDTLDVSLGRDRGIVVDRKRSKDFGETNFIGNKKIETIGLELSVRNTKKMPVTIVVQDQIPVSRHEDIQVDLLEKSNAKFDKQTGILTWELTLEPNQKKKLKFAYRVKYPKNKRINL